ncbi:Ig-like domain-containing protein [Bdellovibrio sp. HCB209]|uniref:Ig-like domain-containing protein n=1 Tax=Bdellovibrio sp. HCB209 TaxID=3394354 RepID=UPI0039B3D980
MDVAVKSSNVVELKIDFLKEAAKADGVDKVELTVTAIKGGDIPIANSEIKLRTNDELENNLYPNECSRTDDKGIAHCTITSEFWSRVRVKAELVNSPVPTPSREPTNEDLKKDAVEAVFYDIYSTIAETSTGSATTYAAASKGEALATVTIRDRMNIVQPMVTPKLKIDGPGNANYTCTVTDAAGVSHCIIKSDVPGDYKAYIDSPPVEHPLPVKFLSKYRTCTIANSTAREEWGENDSTSWGSCKVVNCNVNYTPTSDTTCVADIRVCDPMPTGSSGGTQVWESHGPNQWGLCLISACKLNYTLQGGTPGNTCVADNRTAPPEVLPPHAEEGNQTWDGNEWGPVIVTKCAYPYKVTTYACVPADITPDAFVILDKAGQLLDQVIYSDGVLISGIDIPIKASITGEGAAFLQRLPVSGTDWIAFDPATDFYASGDYLRLALTSANDISTTRTAEFNIGATGPITWNVTTNDHVIPPSVVLNHGNNNKSFTLTWAVGGINNGGVDGCQVQFEQDIGVWEPLAPLVNCDLALPTTTFSLPDAVGYSNIFNSTGLRVRVVQVAGNRQIFQPGRLRCVVWSVLPQYDDPSVDENCNANWTDDADVSPPVGGDFTIVESSPTLQSTINLAITCPTDQQGTVQVAYGNATAPTNWQACAAGKTLVLPTGDGIKTVYMHFRDGYGNTTSEITRSIELDQSSPVNGAFSINNNANSTDNVSVLLDVTCPTDVNAPIETAFDNVNNPTGNWQACASSYNHSLAAGEGVKTVWMNFRDTIGNVTSPSLSDTIILDQSPPVVSLSYTNGWQATGAVTVVTNEADLYTSVANCELEQADATVSNGVVGAFGPYSQVSTSCANYSFGAVNAGAYKFRYRAADELGHVSDWYESASIVKINTTGPSGGNVTYGNVLQTTTPISVSVAPGSDAISAMSTSSADYQLQVAYATLNPSTLSCGAFGGFADAGVAETTGSASFTYTGVQGRCYQFRYIARNTAGQAITYTSSNVVRINFTYQWINGSFGACSGGTGYWSYGGWSGCNGGSGWWSYGGWGGCSASCGPGTQYRSASCNFNANSGSQSRSASCVRNAGSGTQTRTVQCQRSDATIQADSFCGGGKPATSQGCNPTSDAVCGSAVTSQSCTPTNSAVCGGATTAQSCNNGPCCNAANNVPNMCAGYTKTDARYGTMPSASVVAAEWCASGSAKTLSCGPVGCPPPMCAPTAWSCYIECN